MRTFRCLIPFLLAVLVANGLSAGAPASPAKGKTYCLAGFVTRRVPSADLIEKAARAVETKMTGMTMIDDPEDADHCVEVIFRNDTFEIYVDALPFAGRRIGSTRPSYPYHPVPIERSMELADIANTERALGIESHR